MEGQKYPVFDNFGRTLLIVFLLLFFYSSGWASTVDDGIAATKRGDYVSAIEIFKTLSERGDAKAQNNLGAMYQNGLGVTRDPAKAMFWYRKAADQGYAGAQYNICVMYQEGLGVIRDYVQAITWCRKSAEAGYANAQNNLGVMYQNGFGIIQDNAQAIAWYRKAAVQGLVPAQYNLGYMYLNGYGVAKDYDQAVTLYRKAADTGYTEAQGNLGYMYLNGFGVKQDSFEGLKWTLLALASPMLDANTRSIFDKNRDILTTKLTDAQIIAAQQWVSEWKPAIADTSSPPVVRKKSPIDPILPSTQSVENGDAISLYDTASAQSVIDPVSASGAFKAIALIIGIDKYGFIARAELAEDDAKAFYDYAVNDLGIPPERIKMLIGSEAKLLDIREALQTWSRQFIERGKTEVYVHFSGHGLASVNDNALSILPYDIEKTSFADNSIRRREIIDAMINAGAASVTLFFDTCHSVNTRENGSLADIFRLSQIECIPPSVVRVIGK